MVRSSGTRYLSRSALAAAPESFMKVCGLARTSSLSPAAIRAVSDFAARSFSWTRWRAASSSTTRKPRLWRVEAYSGPGLPRPMTSQRPSTGSIGLRRNTARSLDRSRGAPFGGAGRDQLPQDQQRQPQVALGERDQDPGEQDDAAQLEGQGRGVADAGHSEHSSPA